MSKVLTSFPVANAWASPSRVASTPRWPSPGCATKAQSLVATPPTSANTTSPTSLKFHSRHCSTAPRFARAVDCRRELVEEGFAASSCGAFHIRSGGRAYFNTTPLGRAVTGTMLVRAMHTDDVAHLGRRFDLQGQRHRALLSLRPAGQSKSARLQTLARRRLRQRTGRPRRDEPMAGRTQPALPRQQRKSLLYRCQHLGRNPRGQNSRTPQRGHRNRRSHHGRQILGSQRRHQDRRRQNRIPGRPPVSINGVNFDGPRRSGARRPTPSADATGLGMSDQIENRIIEAKSRGIYEAPGMALLWIAYERLLNGIHNEDTTANYYLEGRRLGRLLYEGRWLDPQALMLRESILRWVASLVTGEVTLRLRRGEDYSVMDTADRHCPTIPTNSQWSALKTPPSVPSTESANSRCATSTSPTPAPSSNSTPASRRTRATCWWRTATSSERSSRWRRRPDRAAQRGRLLDDEALDHAAMDVGTD